MDTVHYSNIEYDYGNATQVRSTHQAKPDRTRLNIWLALATMVGLLLCLVAAICVIRVADGEEIHSWRIGPTVVLAVLSTITSTLLGLLLTTSVTIIWWRAVQRGIDVSQLHYMWAVNRNLLFQPHRWKGNLFATSFITKLVTGTVFITLSSFAIPPLLQQAVRPQAWTVATDVAVLTVDIIKQLPSGLAGDADNDGVSASFDFKAAMADWYNKEPIVLPSDSRHQCPGSNSTCAGIIEGPGITVNCNITREAPDLSIERSANFDLFRVKMTLANDTNNEAFINFAVDYVESIDSKCIASLVHKRCSIYSALTNYSISVSGGILEVEKRDVAGWNSTIRTSDPGDLPSAANNTATGALRPLMAMYVTYFESFTDIPKNSLGTYSGGILSQSLKVWGNSSDMIPVCINYYHDPTPYILNGMGESIFRLALGGNKQTGKQTVPPSTPSPVDVPVTVTQGKFVFAPDYRFFAGALFLIVLCLVAGTILVWGWWELKRDVSLSPMETAQVFRDLDRTGDMRVEDLIDIYGKQTVKYAPKELVVSNVPTCDDGYVDGRVDQFAGASNINAYSQGGVYDDPVYPQEGVYDATAYSQGGVYDATAHNSHEALNLYNMRRSGASPLSGVDIVEAQDVDYALDESRPHKVHEVL